MRLNRRTIKGFDFLRLQAAISPLIRRGGQLYYVAGRHAMSLPLSGDSPVGAKAIGLTAVGEPILTLHVFEDWRVFSPHPIEVLEMIPRERLDSVEAFVVQQINGSDEDDPIIRYGLHIGLTTLYRRA